MRMPHHVQVFRDALLAARPATITIPGIEPPLIGRPGIRQSTRIWYNQEYFQKLGRKHEYTFELPDGHLLEFSAQLYMNTSDHWRLFGYCAIDGRYQGMLFSVNLTLGHDGSDVVRLQQKLKLATRGLTSDERSESIEALAERLRGLDFHVTDERDLVLGSLDARSGKFIGTTAADFIRDFVVVAVLKGHYMANKGYRLPDLDEVAQPELNRTPAEIGMEAAEEAAESEGVFDPYDDVDARSRAFRAIVLRRGQAAFRKTLIEAYGGKCAVTGCDFLDVLEAAHIAPYRGDHTDVVTNGLLLRADIHTLFDLGHIAIEPETMTVLVSPALVESVYRDLAGKKLSLPKVRAQRPSQEALQRHREEAGL